MHWGRVAGFGLLFLALISGQAWAEGHDAVTGSKAPAEEVVTSEKAQALYQELEPFFGDKTKHSAFQPQFIGERYTGYKCTDGSRGMAAMIFKVPGQDALVFRSYPRLKLEALEQRTAKFLETYGGVAVGPTGEKEIQRLTKTRESTQQYLGLVREMDKRGLLKKKMKKERADYLAGEGRTLANKAIYSRSFLSDRQFEALERMAQLRKADSHFLKDLEYQDGEFAKAIAAESVLASARSKELHFEEAEYASLFGDPALATNLPKNEIVLREEGTTSEAKRYQSKDKQGRLVQQVDVFETPEKAWGFFLKQAVRDSKGELQLGADGKPSYEEFRCW